MERTLSIEALNQVGKTILLKGWVNSIRSHGKLIFLDLRDRSGIIQVVINPEVSKTAFKTAEKIKPEYVITITGKVNKRPKDLVNPRLKTGTVEVEATNIEILSLSETLPLDTTKEELKVSQETLLDYRSLTLRHPKIAAIFRVQEEIVRSFRQTLKDLDFMEFFGPTIVASATEGGANVFHIDYFKYDAYLAQSPQLYKQILVSSFERVFSIAHAYRAEPSVTTRHLTEYVGLDAEMAFIESFREITDVVEKVIKNIFLDLNKNRQEELKLYNAQTPKVSEKIPILKLREAQEIIFKRTKRDNRNEPDLAPEDEREICKYALEEYGSELIFITHYPTSKRPFYTYPDPENPEFTLSFDLIGRGVEWVTGSQRINDYQKLVSNIKKWGLNPADFEIYLQAFKYGMPPEGGFCLGMERITQLILGLKNVREASLFPRDLERIDQKLSVLQPKRKIVNSKF